MENRLKITLNECGKPTGGVVCFDLQDNILSMYVMDGKYVQRPICDEVLKAFFEIEEKENKKTNKINVKLIIKKSISSKAKKLNDENDDDMPLNQCEKLKQNGFIGFSIKEQDLVNIIAYVRGKVENYGDNYNPIYRELDMKRRVYITEEFYNEIVKYANQEYNKVLCEHIKANDIIEQPKPRKKRVTKPKNEVVVNIPDKKENDIVKEDKMSMVKCFFNIFWN